MEDVAKKLHESYIVQEYVEDVIDAAFKKYEPDIYYQLEYSIGSDWYDNSIEIYFDCSLPYPYEPCKEIREAVFDLGFSSVYWNFYKDETELSEGDKTIKTYDEIRNWEPRHYRANHWKPSPYGYVDERFNEEEWNKKYNYRNR